MTVKHCDNCSACCEVIAIQGHTHDSMRELIDNNKVDARYAGIMIPISRDEAHRRNPRLVEDREGLGQVSFYSCGHLVDNKCGIYDNRPQMCSGYPYYNRFPKLDLNSHAELSKTRYRDAWGEIPYSDKCTYLPGIIPVRNI